MYIILSFSKFLQFLRIYPPALQSRSSTCCYYLHVGKTFQLSQGKMKFLLIITVSILIVLTCMYNNLTIDTKPELKKYVLNFRYGVNFKYEGMLSHCFDRFYVVTMFEMPKFKDLKLMTFSFDLTCEHLNNPKSYIHCFLKHHKKIAPYVEFYCCIMFYQLTSILVISLLNTIAKAWVITEILQEYCIRKFHHFL